MRINWKIGKSKWAYVMLVCCGTVLISPGQVSNSIVVPNEYANKVPEGIGGQIVGFNQLIYSNSQFASIGDQEITINSVALRPNLDGPLSSLDVVVPAITISMGTFTRPLSQLSGIGVNNQGADFSEVYSHQNILMHFVPAGDPNNFSLVFNLDTPFRYNPRNGHLIVEWHVPFFPQAPDARVDSVAYQPTTSPVYDVGEFGEVAFPSGFIANIKYTAVPEPSPLIVMVVLGGLGAMASSSKTGRKILGTRTDTD